jgi:site-specific recombinase XerD
MEMIPYTRSASIGSIVDADPRADASMTIEQCITAWLDEKRGASGSERTHDAYRDTLASFRAALLSVGLDLDSDAKTLAVAAQGFAALSTSIHHTNVTNSTYNQRLAILSSFYEYALRFDVLSHNPIGRVKRRKLGKKDAARPIAIEDVKHGLQQIDRTTHEGLRDYALLSVALATGRRASELASLRYGHLRRVGNQCHVDWSHCKGNKQMEDMLPVKTTHALYTYLQSVYGSQLGQLPNDAPVWVSFSKQNKGEAIGTRTISNMCEEYLGTSKVHATRHTWAVTMHKQGASLQEIGKGLGHSNLKTTSDYMDEQLGYENPYAGKLEDAYGI